MGPGLLESVERILGWAKTANLEVVEISASHSSTVLTGGEESWGWKSGDMPAVRVGMGVGWTAALPSHRYYAALREVTVRVGQGAGPDELERVRSAVSEVAEAEVVRDLDALFNWRIPEGAVISHLTEKNFYAELARDLNGARSSVLILAPFLGNRLRLLVHSLVAARGRGVTVTILVRPQDATKAWVQQFLRPLRAVGVAIVEGTDSMHEKVVVVDRHVAYHGSLNPLSHRDTTESVMRFTCPPIAESLYVLYHPSVGQSFGERVSIEILSGRGRREWRKAWGDPPQWWTHS